MATLISNDEKQIFKQECLKLVEGDIDVLKEKANSLRKEHFEDKVQLCSIVNAKSGLCSENCKYCAQSAHFETGVECYPLLECESIYKSALKALSSGVNNFGIVTSGPDLNDDDFDSICRAVEKISSEQTINVCASLGALTLVQFEGLKAAGLKKYHHNLETSKRFYPEICTTHDWEERLGTVLLAKKAGLKVCSGGLFGLGENWEDRIDLALTLKELDVDCIPINFLNAVPGTPMFEQPKLTPEEALRIVSIYRYILPDKSVRVCGGRPTILGDRREEIYDAGANAIMTGDYLTSYGISAEQDIKKINELGLRVDV